MRVLVTGGRDYRNRNRVHAELDRVDREFSIVFIIHGDANGSDTYAADWAFRQNVPSALFRATDT